VGMGLGLTYDPRQRLTGGWQSSVHVCDGGALHAAVAAWNQRESSWPRRVQVGNEGTTKAGQRTGGCSEVIAPMGDFRVQMQAWLLRDGGEKWGADGCAPTADGADLTWCQMCDPTAGMRRVE
jgi:hypothetical protein